LVVSLVLPCILFPMTTQQPTLLITHDGSPTLIHPLTGESYHSIHGAVRESLHVYITAGTMAYLENFPVASVRILEIGFGSGLNAALTIAELSKRRKGCRYVSLEPYPISRECAESYVSSNSVGDFSKNLFMRLHDAKMEAPTAIAIDTAIASQEGYRHDDHIFSKHACTLADFKSEATFDVIYMDAFSPSTQPELWSDLMLQKLADFLAPGGYLVTYCAKGSVRRGLVAASLEIERLPGPPGKREMLRARKPFLLSKSL
jgi:tRNA U34 5-methylaminomethyl-2-thiouridine-forming methyltransferase MnmC